MQKEMVYRNAQIQFLDMSGKDLGDPVFASLFCEDNHILAGQMYEHREDLPDTFSEIISSAESCDIVLKGIETGRGLDVYASVFHGNRDRYFRLRAPFPMVTKRAGGMVSLNEASELIYGVSEGQLFKPYFSKDSGYVVLLPQDKPSKSTRKVRRTQSCFEMSMQGFFNLFKIPYWEVSYHPLRKDYETGSLYFNLAERAEDILDVSPDLALV